MDEPLCAECPSDVNNTAMVAPDGPEDATIKQQKMAEEFNIQRARLMELYRVKEDDVKRVQSEKQSLETELSAVKEELVQLQALCTKQRDEIQTLGQLVEETVEASTKESNEARQLEARCAELEHRIQQLTKQQQQQQEEFSPSVLVQAVTKSIARKLGADPDKPDTLDDRMKRAQEDVEVLRSLMVPLEEEIKALKDKLRQTDAQLQQHKSKAEGGEGRCDMCANYEAQLVAEQRKSSEEAKNTRHAQLALKMATEELNKAASLHAETLETWKTEQAGAEEEMAGLRARLESAERALASTRESVATADKHTLHKLTQLTVNRQKLQEQLDRLEKENAVLCGRFSRLAQEMQNEEISLPESAEELQLYALRLREELIAACVGRETAVGMEETLRSELLAQGAVVRQHIERSNRLAQENHEVLKRLQKLETDMNLLNERVGISDQKLEQTTAENSKLKEQLAELRSKNLSLQSELDTGEKVQRDFVRLSQSLQVQLERIREADTEVRWQHDEDVSECNSCHSTLPPNKRKLHCRHCGRIFCAPCLARTVLSGPRKTPSSVCTVCHTLLERNTRPYFSTEAPTTPD